MVKWKKNASRSEKVSNFLDDAIGISDFMNPPRKKPAPKPKTQKKPKKNSGQIIIVIDRKNPNKIKIRGFVAKKKKAAPKKPEQTRNPYGF